MAVKVDKAKKKEQLDDQKIVLMIKREVVEMYKVHKFDIERNKPLWIGSAVFAKLRALLNLVEGKPSGLHIGAPIKFEDSVLDGEEYAEDEEAEEDDLPT